MMRMVRNVLHGPVPEKYSSLADAGLWRKLPYALLLAALLLFGCFPKLLTNQIEPDVDRIFSGYQSSSTAARLEVRPAPLQTVLASSRPAAIENQ
jgi:NADH:ubiquinone oxidoreductase subunit 4 (subunit M)